MSAWRRVALVKLPPDLRWIIERAENPIALWIELSHRTVRSCLRHYGPAAELADPGLRQRYHGGARPDLPKRRRESGGP